MAKKYNHMKPVKAYNRDGDEVVFDSMAIAAQTLGVSLPTVRQRIRDGYVIHKENCKPIHVTWA